MRDQSSVLHQLRKTKASAFFTTIALAVWGFGHNRAHAQVFIQGVDQGPTVVESAKSYLNSTTTIIRAASGGTYSGDGISGTTLSGTSHGAQAQNGGAIVFTGATSFSLANVASTYGFYTTGSNSLITADSIQLTANGSSSRGINATGAGSRVEVGTATIVTNGNLGVGVSVDTGATVNLGAGSRVTTNATTTAANAVSLTGGTLLAEDVTLETRAANGSAHGLNLQGGVVHLAGTNSIVAGGSGINTTGTGNVVSLFGGMTTIDGTHGISVTGAGAALGVTGTGTMNIAISAPTAIFDPPLGAEPGGTASSAGINVNGAGARLDSEAGINWLIVSPGSGIQALGGSIVDLDGTVDIRSVGRGIQVRAGGAVNLNAAGNAISTTLAGTNGIGVFLYDTGSSARFGQVAISTSGAATHGVSLNTNNTLALGAGSTITTTGASAFGISAGANNAISATDLTITTNAASNGGGISVGAGSTVNLLGMTRISSGGAGLSAAGAGALVDAGPGKFVIGTAGTNANGVQVSGGARAVLGNGSSVATETGTGINIATGASVAGSNVTIVTNNSQQNLVPLLTALPEYPNLTGIDPIDLNHPADPLNLAPYLIASPARGINLSTGSLLLDGTTNVTSGGLGIYVSNGTATLTGPTVINAGPGGVDNTWMHGLQVTAAGRAQISGAVEINVDSVAGSGVYASGAGSTAILDGGGPINISLLNTRNLDINNVNEAAALYATAGTIEATGNLRLQAGQGRGYGLWAGADPASTIRITGNTAIATHGREGFGIRLDDGLIDIQGNLSIVTGVAPSSADALAGAGSAGLRAIKGALNVSGATDVWTVGSIGLVGSSARTSESAYGLWNTSYSRLAGNGAALDFSGPVAIRTEGSAAHGIYNDSVSGSFSFGDRVDIVTTGGAGAVTWFRTFASIFSSISNETVGAWGVNNAVSGTTTFQRPLTILTTGDGSGGIRSIGGTVSVLDSLAIATAGAGAHGIQASSATAGATTYNGTIDVTGPADIRTTGAGAHAIFADRSGVIGLSGGATLRVADAAAKGILAAGNSVVTGSGRFDVLANLQSQDNARLTLTMSPSSVFTGTTTRSNASVFDLVLADSLWTMTGTSNLTNLTNDPSLIQFTAPTGDPTLLSSYKTLTTVNYIGQGGIIGLNTRLAGDGSPSDRLIIDSGTGTGSSLLRIANAGGAGALTTGNGILVVDAINGGITATGLFALANAGSYVAAGPYAYRLFRSSVDGSNGDAWYLRSSLDCALDRSNPACLGPSPGPDPRPNYRPETSLYAALPSMALLYGRTLLDTLHERVGEEEDQRGRPRNNGFAAGGWGRVVGQHGNEAGSPLGVLGSGPKFSYDAGAMQAGQDLFRWENRDGSRDHAGLYGAIGIINGNVVHVDGTAAGRNGLNVYSIGGYWTHFGAAGWYVDAVLQGSRYDAQAQSTTSESLKTHGWGFAGSLEGGYPIRMAGGFVVEPQAQIVYQTVDLDGAADAAAAVRFQGVESLAARIGARFSRKWAITNNPRLGAITAWIRPSLWNDFRGSPQTLFSSAIGPVPFMSDVGGSWFEITAGVDAEITGATSVFANIGYQASLRNDSEAYSGKIGARVKW